MGIRTLSRPSPEARDVNDTTIYFLRPDPLHKEEKPYAFRFDPGAGVQQSNFTHDPHGGITVRNMRGSEDQFTFERNGFTVLKLPQHVPYDAYHDPQGIRAYFVQLESLLRDHLGASHVEVFRHGLRKRDESFPVSTGNDYQYDQPTSVAHVDTTPQEALEEVKRQHGANATSLLEKRVQWVNIWKPLRGPLNDWPLAVCDVTSVRAERDFEDADLLYTDLATENCQVYFSEAYQWHYLSDHQVDELIVFKQSDTDPKACPGVPHSSFWNPFVSEHEPPRESIEARALVYYD